jgi:hypothetical protein
MTWPQAVDEALCFGWIDGVRRRVDDDRYQIRFTPRKPGSTWSAVNIDRFAELQKQGRVTPAGIAAFEQRTEKKSRTYSYEQAESPEFNPAETKEFKRNKPAWAFFEALPPSYRRKVVWWIRSAGAVGPAGQVQLFPVVLFGSDYWRGLVDWVRDRLLADGKIAPGDLDLLRVSDSVPETCRYLLEAYQHETWKAPGQAGGSGSAPAGYP